MPMRLTLELAHCTVRMVCATLLERLSSLMGGQYRLVVVQLLSTAYSRDRGEAAYNGLHLRALN